MCAVRGKQTLTALLWCPENEFYQLAPGGMWETLHFHCTGITKVLPGLSPRNHWACPQCRGGALGSLAARDAQRHLGRWRAAELLLGSPRLPLPRVGPHLGLSRCAVSGSWAPVGACLGKEGTPALGQLPGTLGNTLVPEGGGIPQSDTVGGLPTLFG